LPDFLGVAIKTVNDMVGSLPNAIAQTISWLVAFAGTCRSEGLLELTFFSERGLLP
jgi:hypothetical protein